MLSNSAQAGGDGHPVSPPVLAYRVYPDGREELVRGLRFRGLNARSLKDILAAGDDDNVFEFLNSPAPFATIGAASYVAESCVIAPSVLVDDVECIRSKRSCRSCPSCPRRRCGRGRRPLAQPMRILDRYIFREILSSSLLGVGLATAIIFLQGVGKLFEVLVRTSPRPATILYLSRCRCRRCCR